MSKKEMKLAKEFIGVFFQLPFRSRELCFPCKICLLNQLELVLSNSHKREY